MGCGGCVGMTIKVLGVGLFMPPIGGGKWDDAGGRWMKHPLVIYILSHSEPPVKRVVWAGPRPKEKTDEHWTHVLIWADGHREEGSAGPQKCRHDLLACQCIVVVWIAAAVPHQLPPFLVNQVLEGQSRLIA
jgi:hypothetical protein